MGQVLKGVRSLLDVLYADTELHNKYWSIVEEIEISIDKVAGNNKTGKLNLDTVFDEVMKNLEPAYTPIAIRVISEACKVPTPYDRDEDLILYHRLLEYLNSNDDIVDSAQKRRLH